MGFKVETPKLAKLYDYWLSKSGDRAMPSRGDLDPVIDIPELTAIIYMIDVECDPPGFRYRLVGTEMAEMYGADLTGKRLDEVDFGDHHEAIRRDYEEAVKARKPTYSQFQFYVETTDKLLLYERILLPLSDDGETVNMLLSGGCALGQTARKSPPTSYTTTVRQHPDRDASSASPRRNSTTSADETG